MRRRWLAGIFACCAVWAVLVGVVSNNVNDKIWGDIAAVGYGLALLVVLAVRHSRAVDIALWLVFLGGLMVPLACMVVENRMQPEVGVVIQSAWSLIHHGTPYLSRSQLAHLPAGEQKINHFNPYLPVMALFGLPSVLFGVSPMIDPTHALLWRNLPFDPRVWFGAVFIAVFWLALRRGGARDPGRWVLLVAGSPIIAFELALGGTDVPMVAFLCLGFAYLWGRTPLLAGLALGIASAMKATAWPALLVAVVLLWVTEGRRATRDFVLAALGVMIVCAGPFLATDGRALILNTIKFPLGLSGTESAARSPLPGYLIAEHLPHGHGIVTGLLGIAAIMIGLSLVLRPPRSVPRAVILLAGAMTLMFVLAPSTRVGYFIYPAGLAIWLFAGWAGRRAADNELLGEVEVGFLPARVPDSPPGP
jgi:Glycosyltransferase family 87